MARPLAAAILVVLCAAAAPATASWSDAERAQVAALSLSRLGPPPADASNRFADDGRAAALGRRLFFEPHLSRNGKLSCASCHRPELEFTDGLPESRGLRPLRRNAPSLLTAAWHRWQFWDGRADSLWMQALVPLLHADELGLTPAAVRRTVEAHYHDAYEPVFGALSAQDDAGVVANVGKSIAAFERTLRPRATRFDRFADALARGEDPDLLMPDEQAGLRLFVGKAQCLRCHHGPLLTNESFQNTGLGKRPGRPSDHGRAAGVAALRASEFNCRGPHNDDPLRRCQHLDFLRPVGLDMRAAFKVPSLRHVAQTAPYMHDGRFATLAEVLDHYNRAPGVHEGSGHTELFPLALSPAELPQLEAFLRTLSPDAPAGRDKPTP